MGEFSPPLFLNHADAQTSNTSTRLWFYYIITKIHPPFQNPGSAPDKPFTCLSGRGGEAVDQSGLSKEVSRERNLFQPGYNSRPYTS